MAASDGAGTGDGGRRAATASRLSRRLAVTGSGRVVVGGGTRWAVSISTFTRESANAARLRRRRAAARRRRRRRAMAHQAIRRGRRGDPEHPVLGAERHLTNADDRGPDNSVRLVARKPAWVRVYVRSGIFGPSQDLTGDLVVEPGTGVLLTDWSTLATLDSAAGGIRHVAAQSRLRHRARHDHVLAQLHRRRRSHAGDHAPHRAHLGTRRPHPHADRQLAGDGRRQLLQTLSLRGVFVTYSGPDPTKNATNPPTVNLPAPTLANLQSTAAWTLTTNPLESQGVFSSAGQMNWFAPLTGTATSPGGCSSGWQAFNYWLSLIKNNDGNRSDVIYYGLLPAATPIANVSGCELYGVSAGTDTDQQTMAHEIGHGAGLKHGPCNVTGTTVDAGYPAYEPYDPANTPTASIGEYGLDITNGTIHPPTTDKDYMSYCGPAWISLYNHAQLCNNSAFNPRTAGLPHWRPPDLVDPYLWPWEYIPDPPNWERHPGDLRAKAEALISILGTVDETGELAVHSVTRVQALRRTRAAVPTQFVAQLIGEQDEPIASAAVVRLPAQGSGCGCRRRRWPGRWPVRVRGDAVRRRTRDGAAHRRALQGEQGRRDRLDARRSVASAPHLGLRGERRSRVRHRDVGSPRSSGLLPPVLAPVLQGRRAIMERPRGRHHHEASSLPADPSPERPVDLPPAGARRLPHHDRGVATGGDSPSAAHREHPEPACGSAVLRPLPATPLGRRHGGRWRAGRPRSLLVAHRRSSVPRTDSTRGSPPRSRAIIGLRSPCADVAARPRSR